MNAWGWCLLLCVVAPATQLADVRALIAAKGASKALAELNEDNDRWESVLVAIGEGSSQWLEVATQLRAVSDGGATLGLRFAIQEALPRNPRGVLRLVTAGSFAPDEACGGYGFGQIEDKRPSGVIRALVDKRLLAIETVKEPDLSAVRKRCHHELEVLRSAIQ